jgi:hypothetical protein
MHQTMNNFSDITAIDTAGQLSIGLQLQFHGNTESLITLNGHVVGNNSFNLEIDLFDPIKLSIDLLSFDEGTSGIEIQSLIVNGLEVLPKYQHLASKPTNYIDQLGIWTFKIPPPFYVWYHLTSGQGWIA